MASCGLILFNAVLAAPTIYQKQINIAEQNRQKLDININSNIIKELPNVYFIILDEYSSFNFIEKYYGYDNSDFASYLENKGFTVSYESYNESISTSTIIPNLLNLDYVVNDDMTQAEKMNMKNNSELISLLKQNGYKIKAIEMASTQNPSTWPPIESDIAGTIKADTTSDFNQILIDKSVIYPFLNPNISDHASLILNSFAAINSYSDQTNNIFTYAHIICPHEYFVFDENGDPISPKDRNNYSDKEIYLSQYIYTTKLISQVIDQILDQNKNSIIILQSDHSCRFQWDEELLNKFDVDKAEVHNILNAVYYQGEVMNSIKGQSGINTLRLVFNKLLNLNLETLEVENND
jgi:hypothetical protein